MRTSSLIALGLSAAVVGVLAALRKPEPAAGDVVSVPLGRVALENGQGVPSGLTSLIPQGALLAVRVRTSANGRVIGQAEGWADPATGALSLPGAVAAGAPALPVANPWLNANFPAVLFARSDVTGIYRGSPLKRL